MKHPFQVAGEPPVALPPEGASDLRLRAVSAAVLIVAGVAAVWWGGVLLMLVTGAAAGLMAWEMLRMAAPDDHVLRRTVGGAVTGVVVALGGLSPIHTLVTFFLFPVLVLIFIAFWPRYRWLSGAWLIYIAAACGAFLLLRNVMPAGRDLVIGMLACIWATDIAAYAGGRAIRGPRLAPGISPNKTWAGFIAGVLAGALAGVSAGLIMGGNTVAWVLIGLMFGVVGQAGDLVESWTKRHFGVKDASGIIPGHGGLLDRLDGHLACTGVFAVLLLVFPPLALVLS